MLTPTARRALLTAGLAGTAWLSSALALASGGDEGGAVEYKFRLPPVNSMGVTSMEDLRGRPVLIDYWGTR